MTLYEIWLGEGRGTVRASSFAKAKAILRGHFKGAIYLSHEYRTDNGVGWAVYGSARERSADYDGGRGAYVPSIERLDREGQP